VNQIQAAFKSAKSNNWSGAIVSLYIAHRVLDPNTRTATYAVLSVNADEKLRKRLRSIANKTISVANRVIEYDFNTADHDDDFLGLTTSETDMQRIVDQITSTTPRTADKVDDLLNAWVYIIRLTVRNEEPLFSVRQVSKGWSTKKVSQLTSLIFENNMLMDLDDKQVFKIDNQLDFFSYNGAIFIADKKNFELAMNFRLGMEQNRDSIVGEFVANNVLNSTNKLVVLVGNNLRRLRKLAQVKKAGYYKDPNYMARLKAINRTENWGLKYLPDGTLNITDDNIDDVLRILNNDRLRSPINDENFNVDVKHKLL